ncbi:DUF6065 family protein [Methylocella sp. CPCC 101449]|uniref:DUF6065 family protein n=1 Tax=Methylocella sp. CPCC 101449 TaxID=2987531 RepID=UPI00288EE90B|nr:DUF6065 family protein [Methylocella sp. CPCC 101449]MDT2021214.1 DUF6065 family protein [Methylocella sp. CPCC 101449]
MNAPKLDCFALSKSPPLLVPAGMERSWMDKTSDHFAYRCTPLAIANATGWELLNPSGFSATWTGGNGKDDIILRPHEPGQSLHQTGFFFGHGIISFHPGYLFRTDPDWVVWARGAPNRIKDGIHPLEGLVETNWLPFTFTMNWKFTRPCTVHFEKDEPFCFITVVPSVAIESIEPCIRQIEDEPNLHKELKIWTSERTKFAAAQKLGDALALEQKWQKNYLMGKSPSGRSVADDNHRVKRKLKPPVSGCPVKHAPE